MYQLLLYFIRNQILFCYILFKQHWFYLYRIKMEIRNRKAVITVFPTASAVIIKALNEQKRDDKRKGICHKYWFTYPCTFCLLSYNKILYKYADKGILHKGDLSLEQVIECAKVMRANSNARLFAGTVMEMLGTSESIGCTVNDSDPRHVQRLIKSGQIEINQDYVE